MRTTIDRVGRLVIPKELRDRLGLGPGEVDVYADGAGLRVEAVATDRLEETAGRLIVAASGASLDDAEVARIRDLGQR
jgi:AbrB family looped-hinge helix DNA binding protein